MNDANCDLVIEVGPTGLYFSLYVVEETFPIMFSTINVREKCQTHPLNSFREKIIIKETSGSQ